MFNAMHLQTRQDALMRRFREYVCYCWLHRTYNVLHAVHVSYSHLHLSINGTDTFVPMHLKENH